MKKLYESDYLIIEYYKSKRLVKIEIKPDSGKMSESIFKKESLVWAKFLTEYKAECMLVDGRNFRFIVTPELQGWLNENLTQVGIKAGLRKYANVIPQDLFVAVSVEQLTPKNTPKDFQVKLTPNYEEAFVWVIS